MYTTTELSIVADGANILRVEHVELLENRDLGLRYALNHGALGYTVQVGQCVSRSAWSFIRG